ncbi:MAG: ferritin family protein [Pseudomonadota bacterium]
MSDKTDKNLAYAFAAESKASARNMAFAQKADLDGYPQIGRLLRKTLKPPSKTRSRPMWRNTPDS